MAAEGGTGIAAKWRGWRDRALRRWVGHLTALGRAEDGISAVEFALATPVLLLLILPLLDLGQAASEQIRLNLAVQAGAQYASLNLWGSTSSSDIANVVNNATTMSLSNVSATEVCGCPNANGTITPNPYPSAPDSCASKYPSCPGDSSPAGVYVQVSAQFTHAPVVPYSAFQLAVQSATGHDSSYAKTWYSSTGQVSLTSTAIVRTY
jgi:Flp pilus assembly protein TadG